MREADEFEIGDEAVAPSTARTTRVRKSQRGNPLPWVVGALVLVSIGVLVAPSPVARQLGAVSATTIVTFQLEFPDYSDYATLEADPQWECTEVLATLRQCTSTLSGDVIMYDSEADVITITSEVEAAANAALVGEG